MHQNLFKFCDMFIDDSCMQIDSEPSNLLLSRVDNLLDFLIPVLFIIISFKYYKRLKRNNDKKSILLFYFSMSIIFFTLLYWISLITRTTCS